MGQFYSKAWYIYHRDMDDSWNKTALASTLSRDTDRSYHMGRFKNAVYYMAVSEAFHKVYLYKGSQRQARAECKKRLCTITFLNAADKNRFYGAREQTIHTDFGITGPDFEKKWKLYKEGAMDITFYRLDSQ